jgi:D-glycero-beta-D-manno-heptose 1-phosphate adenylyltransferase
VSAKIISRAEVSALGDRLRREGRRITFANGCFDLLHVGHVRFLRGAAEQEGVLVVGVNGDRAVSTLKGTGRPLLPAEARAELVAALESVNYVVIFEELTAEGVLRELRPNVQCKGTDYTPETVPEREVVKSWGGAIRIVGDSKKHSTRDIIKQIIERVSKQ